MLDLILKLVLERAGMTMADLEEAERAYRAMWNREARELFR